MPRYVKQPDKASCGPIVIMNALKWGGRRRTLKNDFWRLARACDCSPGNYGSSINAFDRTLRNETRGHLNVKRRYRSSIREIEEHLCQRNGAVIINYLWICKKTGKRHGHFALFTNVSKTGRMFTGINDKRGITIVSRRRSTLLRHLRLRGLRDERSYPMVWLLTKMENSAAKK